MPRKLDVVIDGSRVQTGRLSVRPWAHGDAWAALAVFGRAEVAHWLAPAISAVPDVESMERLLRSWTDNRDGLTEPMGRWAIELRESGEVVGGVSVLPLPPDAIDQEIAVQVAPAAWGSGVGAEAGHAMAHYAFASGLDEIFAVTRRANHRAAAMARRMGMEWVGETEKYYDLRLEVFRLRKGDLDIPGLRDSEDDR